MTFSTLYNASIANTEDSTSEGMSTYENGNIWAPVKTR